MVTFKWTTECQTALNMLECHLTTSPVLAYQEYSKPLFLNRNASDMGIDVVLSQEDNGGQERVIALEAEH